MDVTITLAGLTEPCDNTMGLDSAVQPYEGKRIIVIRTTAMGPGRVYLYGTPAEARMLANLLLRAAGPARTSYTGVEVTGE